MDINYVRDIAILSLLVLAAIFTFRDPPSSPPCVVPAPVHIERATTGEFQYELPLQSPTYERCPWAEVAGTGRPARINGWGDCH